MSEPIVRLGVAGLGRAFSLMLPTFMKDKRVRLMAAADPRAEARARFASEFSAKTYETVEALCADPALDAIYIATPHQFHAEQAQLAAAAKKHILVEKPMALGLDACQAMIDTARDAGVKLIVGHSHSFDRPIQRARDIIAGGTLGRVRMITAMNFTDFLYRPRRPEELDTAKGGGVFFNQAPHQIDIIRLLGGGRLRSVRASAGAWDNARPTDGAYSAHLTFEDGAFASVTYSGYAHFDSDAWCDGIGEDGRPKKSSSYGDARRKLAALDDPTAEQRAKAAGNYGGTDYSAPVKEDTPPFYPHFGVVIASCERADLRPTPKGVMIYADATARFEALPTPLVPRSEVMDELCAAVFDSREPLHNGAWGMATMEVCLAMLQSARDGQEVTLRHQVGLPILLTGLAHRPNNSSSK
jgi:phthalate 4,5-cis-dihydrodiol dehydrogenase